MSFTTLFTALHYHFSLLIFFIMLFFFPPFKCGSHKKTAIKENLSIKKPPIFLFLPFCTIHQSIIAVHIRAVRRWHRRSIGVRW